ncbi:hypothetical protein LPJ66_009724, partial [Kickxella alabastrina]
MQLPFFALVAICTLSVLLPLPKHYAVAPLHTALSPYTPNFLLTLLLHPALTTPLFYYVLLRLVHFLLSIPVKLFLSRFGLDVRSFSGTSFSGLLLTIKVRGKYEVVVRVDEIGVDVRTMRRLRVRVREAWRRAKARVQGRRREGNEANTAVSDTATLPPPPPTPLVDSSSAAPVPAPASGVSGNGLSKRLQIYARGVHIQLLSTAKPEPTDDGPTPWFGLPEDEEENKDNAEGDGQAQPQTRKQHRRKQQQQGPETRREMGNPVLDTEAQELAGKLAKKISATLRTYTYVASLFSRWVDISVSDVSVVLSSGEMARAGHGVTLMVSNLMLWAESARENQGEGWTRPGFASSVLGVVDWLLRLANIRAPES